MSCPCPYTKTRVVTLSAGNNVFGDGNVNIDVPNSFLNYAPSDPEYIEIRGTKLYIITNDGTNTCVIYHNNGTSQTLGTSASQTIYGVIDAVIIVVTGGGVSIVEIAECYNQRPRAEQNLASGL